MQSLHFNKLIQLVVKSYLFIYSDIDITKITSKKYTKIEDVAELDKYFNANLNFCFHFLFVKRVCPILVSLDKIKENSEGKNFIINE